MRVFSNENLDLSLFDVPSTDAQAAVEGAETPADGAAPVADSSVMQDNPAPVQVNGNHHGGNGSESPARHTPLSGPRRRARLIELYETASIQRLIDDLANKGLKIEHYSAQDKPLFELVEGEGDRAVTKPIFSMPAILDRVKENGRRGVQIKRFKGLGEMNAKELFSTTMDPGTRKLLQVDLNEDNKIKADKMFNVLMGDVVEPRRQFIEDNALNVRNLDV